MKGKIKKVPFFLMHLQTPKQYGQKNSKHLKLSVHVDRVLMTDSQNIACAFNEFFINSVQNLGPKPRICF